ncbi:MAG: extracellular solute-binding protein [Paracoccaceae bacterium]|nr:extracellular solute-binding protein [Paracoccaceae bacterium]
MRDIRRPQALALTREIGERTRKRVLMVTLLGLSALMWSAALVKAEGHEDVIVSHGYNEYDELKYGPDDAHLAYVNPQAPEGGEISISWVGTFDSMNPFATGIGTPGVLSSSMYEDIMTTTADEVGSYYCVLCTTLEYPESQDWVIFNLRDDVFFSDGERFDAGDIKFSFELLRDEGTPSIQAYFKEAIASVEILDTHRIKFTFAEGIPRKGLLTQMGVLPAFPQHWYEATGAKLDESRMEIGPGTGEYMLDSIDPGRRIVYRRNPEYWGRDHYLNVGRGNYDTIRIEYFGDTTAAFEAFKAGEVTFRQENSSLQWATAYDFPALNEGSVVRNTLPSGILPAARGFIFNMTNPKFEDRNLRRALGMMFNFTWTNESLQYGLFSQRESFWENERLKATGLPEGRELELLEPFRDQLPEAIFTEPAYLPHESGARPMDRRNRGRALELMAEAGYTPGDDGMLRDANGRTLDIEFIEETQSMDRILLPYIENLQALGVNATYNRIDPAQYQNRIQNKNFDMRDAAYPSGLVEGSGLSQRYGCEDRMDVFNDAGYCNPVVDALADQLLEIETYDEMAAIIRAVDRIMRYDYFMVPVWMLQANWVAHYDMFEHPEELPPFSLGHLDFWWINQEKAGALEAAGVLR